MAPIDEIPSDGLLDLDDLSETTLKLTLPRQNRAKRMTIPTLRVVAGPDMLRFCSLSAGEELLIGRDENCGLSLTDASVSRYHARLSSSPNGEVMVQDLGSTNGTAINARSTRRGILRPGDHLEIGAVSLRLDMLGLDELAHLARIQERLNAADRDPLTGLMARTFLDDGMPLLVDRCNKANVPIAAIFMVAQAVLVKMRLIDHRTRWYALFQAMRMQIGAVGKIVLDHDEQFVSNKHRRRVTAKAVHQPTAGPLALPHSLH